MKAIQIKYLPATNTKGSRLKAIAYGGLSLTAPFDYEATDGGERNLAEAFCAKYNWSFKALHDGSLPDGSTVFVMEI